MAFKVVTFLVILFSLSGLLEANEDCGSYEHKVDKDDYADLLKVVYDRTGNSFGNKDVQYMTYEKKNGDIKYCCDLRKVSGGRETKCIVAWYKSGRGSSASCSSGTIH